MKDDSGNTAGRLVGYARVSTGQQDLALQTDALRAAGVSDDRIFCDKVSGAKQDRPGLDQCLRNVSSGDTLVVWRLDRLGRSLRHLVALIEELNDRGVAFRSLSDGAIDTTSASGKLVFGIFAALAEFERHLIQERTKAGLAAARARGRLGGRRKIEAEDPRVITAKALHSDPGNSVVDICRALRVSKTTLYRWLKIT